MGGNGNGTLLMKVITTSAITGFCGLCFMGFFYISGKVEANTIDHVSIRREAEKRVDDRNQLLRDMMKESNQAHSEILQRVTRIEAAVIK